MSNSLNPEPLSRSHRGTATAHSNDPDLTAYARELDAWVKAFLSGRPGAQSAPLDRRTRRLLRMFTEGNQEKRRQLLEKQLDFLKPAFEELADLLDEYVQAVPFHAADVGTQDPDRFLRWLTRRYEVTAEQRDYIFCQRARHAVERKARQQRLDYMHFLERWSLVQQLLPDLDSNTSLRVVVNPILAWARFHTPALLGTTVKPPAMVLFHAFREQTLVAVPSRTDRKLLRQLSRLGPVTLEEWADHGLSREELIDFVHRWAPEGVLALV
jgi:hypothetical protein